MGESRQAFVVLASYVGNGVDDHEKIADMAARLVSCFCYIVGSGVEDFQPASAGEDAVFPLLAHHFVYSFCCIADLGTAKPTLPGVAIRKGFVCSGGLSGTKYIESRDKEICVAAGHFLSVIG
jgi:hypothetical protein